MSDVSNNVSDTVDVQVYAVDQDGTGEETSAEIEEEIDEGTEETEEESIVEFSDVSGNDIVESEEPSEGFDRIEGETVENGEEYLSETVDISNDSLSDTTDYSNYLSFLIAVVLGIGAVICWAKGFTE